MNNKIITILTVRSLGKLIKPNKSYWQAEQAHIVWEVQK